LSAVPADKPRLVVFVTFTPKVAVGPDGKVRRKRHPMAADACQHRDPFNGADINDKKKVDDAKAKDMTAFRRKADLMWSNSSFSVFRCAGPKKDVTLVCHTEHFLMNPYNTREVFKGSNGNKKSPDWLSKSNDAPPRFMVQVGMPAFGESFNFYGAMWHQVLKGDGTNLMKGNFMHSMINTNGCWMLFRNWNYPVKMRERLSTEGIMSFRWPGAWDGPLKGGTRGTVLHPDTLLQQVGYVSLGLNDLDTGKNDLLSSRMKFFMYDRNFAATWFAHDVLGIRYWGGSDTLNDYRTHGLGSDADLLTFPVSQDFGGYQKQYDPYDAKVLARYSPKTLGLPPLEGGVERDPEDGDEQELVRRPGERGPDATWKRDNRLQPGRDEIEGEKIGKGTSVVHVDNAHPTYFISPGHAADDMEGDPRDIPPQRDAASLNAMWVKNAFGDQVASGFAVPWGDMYFFIEPGAIPPDLDSTNQFAVPHPEDKA
jgi:hypothetical protein